MFESVNLEHTDPILEGSYLDIRAPITADTVTYGATEVSHSATLVLYSKPRLFCKLCIFSSIYSTLQPSIASWLVSLGEDAQQLALLSFVSALFGLT